MKDNCSFCKETNCAIHDKRYFPTIDKEIFVDIRVDMDFNQIDFEFGILNEDPRLTLAEWSNCAINMNYCPICGRKLEKTSFM